MLLALVTVLAPFAQEALQPTGEVVLTEIACVPLRAPRRPEGSIERGATPDLDSLSSLNSLTILPSGRVLACDWRDGSVHEFDQHGDRVALFGPTELRSNPAGPIEGDHRGHVFLQADHSPSPSEPHEYEFAPGGDFLGARPRRADEDGVRLEYARALSPFEDVRWTWRAGSEMTFERAGVALNVWPRRPDLGPWRQGGACFLRDGRSTVLDRHRSPAPTCFAPTREALQFRPDPRQFLFVFDARGGFVEQWELPEEPRWCGPWAGAQRLLLWGENGEWLLVDVDAGTWANARLQEGAERDEDERREWNVVLRPEGVEELWIVERNARRLIRFAFPD